MIRVVWQILGAPASLRYAEIFLRHGVSPIPDVNLARLKASEEKRLIDAMLLVAPR